MIPYRWLMEGLVLEPKRSIKNVRGYLYNVYMSSKHIKKARNLV